jgi:hypothetical protein
VAVVPIGGGGLISGIAMALKAHNPKVRIIGVESSDGPAMKRSIDAGTSSQLDRIDTIIDGLRVKRVGDTDLRSGPRLRRRHRHAARRADLRRRRLDDAVHEAGTGRCRGIPNRRAAARPW